MRKFRTKHGTLTMDLPAVYRIRVVGTLDPQSAEKVAGMQITRAKDREGDAESVLIGSIPDQAALSGILNALYEMHLPVKEVECLDAERDDETHQ